MRLSLAFLAPFALAAAASAAVVNPAVEGFETDAANWFNGAETAVVDWNAAGGFDGGAYVSATTVVPDPVPAAGLTLFRAQDEFGSSGGLFEGDWISAGITELSFWIRHDAAAPVNIFARASGPGNFPGVVMFEFAPVAANVWTEVTIDIDPANPAFLFEGPSTFGSVFGNVGHLQFGILPDDGFIGTTITLDLDNVRATPAPSALALLALGLIAPGRRRR